MKLADLAACTLISLDQCFLSRLAIKRKRDADFDDLLHTLFEAVRAKRVVCPAHLLTTKYESLKLRDPVEVAKVLNLQQDLSLGCAFHEFWDIIAWKMLQMVRPSLRFERCKRARMTWEHGTSLEMKRLRLKAMDQQRVETINAVPFPASDYRKGTPYEETLAEIEREREDSMRLLLKGISSGMRVAPRIDWMAGVRDALMRDRVTLPECAALLEAVDDGRWRQIDVLRVNSMLFAKIEQGMLEGGRAWRLSDHADIYRLCVSLLCADIATCDNPMKDVLKQTKLEGWCRATVFTVTKPRALTAYLQSLT
jgi:hypothetical protein